MLEDCNGRLITLEGPDGAGKTTAMDHLMSLLNEYGYPAIRTREPGGTPIGEELRNIVLNKSPSITTELLIFAAARAEHMDKLIFPMLREGKIVVSDRFSDSTFAYQGLGRGYISEVEQLESFVLKGFEPHYTLFLDITLAESARRLHGRSEESNRLDREQDEFKERVYRGYHHRLKSHSHRMVVIDAMQDIEGVKNQITTWFTEKFIPNNPVSI